MAHEVIYNPKRWIERALKRARCVVPRPVPEKVVHSGREWWGGFSYANFHNYTILLLEELAAKSTLTHEDELTAITAATRLEGTIEELKPRKVKR